MHLLSLKEAINVPYDYCHCLNHVSLLNYDSQPKNTSTKKQKVFFALWKPFLETAKVLASWPLFQQVKERGLEDLHFTW